MSVYGKAFKTIRLLKDIRLEEAAEALKIDSRTLRDIESGNTSVISERFEQLIQLYEVRPETIFELSADQAAFQNMIQPIKGNSVSAQKTPTGKYEQSELLIEVLQDRIRHLEANEIFLKSLIERLK